MLRVGSRSFLTRIPRASFPIKFLVDDVQQTSPLRNSLYKWNEYKQEQLHYVPSRGFSSSNVLRFSDKPSEEGMFHLFYYFILIFLDLDSFHL